MKSMHFLTVSEAQKLLPKILQLVAAGEEIVIVNRRNKQKFQVTLYQEASDQKPQPQYETPADLQEIKKEGF